MYWANTLWPSDSTTLFFFVMSALCICVLLICLLIWSFLCLCSICAPFCFSFPHTANTHSGCIQSQWKLWGEESHDAELPCLLPACLAATWHIRTHTYRTHLTRGWQVLIVDPYSQTPSESLAESLSSQQAGPAPLPRVWECAKPCRVKLSRRSLQLIVMAS